MLGMPLSSRPLRWLNLFYRFGHDAISNCTDCQTFLQFALYALPIALLDYLRNIFLFGLVTMQGTGRERLRLLGTGVLVVAAAFEAWWICTVEIQVPRDGLGVIMVRIFSFINPILTIISGMTDYISLVKSFS